MEHERRFYLHVKFIRRDRGVKWSGRCRYSSCRQTRGRRASRLSRLRDRRWARVHGRRRLALHGQIACRPQRSIPRWRTSTFQRHRHIHAIELPGTKHELVGRLDLVSAIAEQFGNNCRCRVAGQRAHAGIALTVRTDGIVKFSWPYQKNAEVRRHHGIGRSVESEVRFQCARVHAEHQVMPVLRRSNRHRRSRTNMHLAATRQAENGGIGSGRNRGTACPRHCRPAPAGRPRVLLPRPVAARASG